MVLKTQDDLRRMETRQGIKEAFSMGGAEKAVTLGAPRKNQSSGNETFLPFYSNTAESFSLMIERARMGVFHYMTLMLPERWGPPPETVSLKREQSHPASRKRL